MLADTPDYLKLRIHADSGPLGTHDYGFELEATPSAPGRTFIHLRYTVGYGHFAHLVTHGYLNTTGRDRVGFSMAAAQDGGASALVSGERGAIERNAMRYCLAIAAYLDSLTVPADDRVEHRLQAWFEATERYKTQLHEIDLGEYLAMKRHEVLDP